MIQDFKSNQRVNLRGNVTSCGTVDEGTEELRDAYNFGSFVTGGLFVLSAWCYFPLYPDSELEANNKLQCVVIQTTATGNWSCKCSVSVLLQIEA